MGRSYCSVPFKDGKVDFPALIGMVVYKAYTPQSPGVVVGISGWPGRFCEDGSNDFTHGRFRRVRVKWLKKGQPETTEEIINLSFLQDLIADHEQKLANARKLYDRCVSEITVPKGVK